jgi:hypothetical protein
MDETIPFISVDTYPQQITASSIIVRLLDGLGYRFRYATESLKEKDYNYNPGEGCNTIAFLIDHIWGLVNWVYLSVTGEKETKPQTTTDQRVHILVLISELKTLFEGMEDSDLQKIKIYDFPFWHIINGPLSDALTHTGQINLLRRLAGNPPVKSDVFRMRKV